ncbi:MAG TPA: hypothetical protein PLY54_05115 [Ottowia sp.]|nr:hypothetical protein [Ottowia sp.]
MSKLLGPYKTAGLIATIIAVASCGGGGGDQSKVAYSDKVAAGTVANYTDANWLFQNYLGDYGVPEQIKPQFMPALKLLANGFDLQLKKGQDVKGNIEQIHSMFLHYQSSGGATKFFAQLQDISATSAVSDTVQVDVPTNPNFVEPVISDEDKAAIAAAKQRDAAERIEIQKIAQQYGLPYRIDGIPEQWFIYSPTMKGGGKGGGGGGGSNPPKAHTNVKTWGWRRGDMVWVNGTGSIPGVPGHNAIIWGEGSEVYLIDSNTDVGVSLARDLQGWFERYTEVRALTPRLNWSLDEYNCYNSYGGAYGCAKDSWQRINAWWYAYNRQGSPYNWNFTNPRDTNQFYCSSLLWNAYNYVGYNAIAPWGLGYYTVLTPSMIRDSGAVVTFKVSTK